ncbi:hypothetical protein ACVGWV_14855, partial [Enterobacter asburiae]
IHGSALKKRWGGPPPETLNLARPRRLRTPKNISRLLCPHKPSDIRSIFPSPPIKNKKNTPGLSIIKKKHPTTKKSSYLITSSA